jgi:hypothetical protein
VGPLKCHRGCGNAQVRPDSSVAQRSQATGRLVLTMPKEQPGQRCVDVTHMRPRAEAGQLGSSDQASSRQPAQKQAAVALGAGWRGQQQGQAGKQSVRQVSLLGAGVGQAGGGACWSEREGGSGWCCCWRLCCCWVRRCTVPTSAASPPRTAARQPGERRRRRLASPAPAEGVPGGGG